MAAKRSTSRSIDSLHAAGKFENQSISPRNRTNSLRRFFPVFQRSIRTSEQVWFRLYPDGSGFPFHSNMRFSGIPWIINVLIFSFN